MELKDESRKIVVVGSCNIDLTCYVKNLPNPTEMVRGERFTSGFGGKGGNQAVAIGKLGGNVSLISRLGNDSFSNGYLKILRESNVDATYVKKTKNTPNGTAMIMVGEAGENVIVCIKGANDFLKTKDLEKARAIIENAAVIVCQLEINHEVSFTAMEMCKGIKILHAFPGIANIELKLSTIPTILCINEITAPIFTGIAVNTIPEAKQVIKLLLKRGSDSVILLLGAHGAVYGSKERPNPISIPSPRITSVDTTGSGDMFVAALAYLVAYRQNDMNMEQMIKVACCVAADSCTRHGTQTSYPGPEIFKTCTKSEKAKSSKKKVADEDES